MFCLIRVASTKEFLLLTNYIFCVLFAFKSVFTDLTVFQTIVLKKIDFEPLLQELAERLRLESCS
jgi:hypothetical protein